jgi:hypothetical protein
VDLTFSPSPESSRNLKFWRPLHLAVIVVSFAPSTSLSRRQSICYRFANLFHQLKVIIIIFTITLLKFRTAMLGVPTSAFLAIQSGLPFTRTLASSDSCSQRDDPTMETTIIMAISREKSSGLQCPPQQSLWQSAARNQAASSALLSSLGIKGLAPPCHFQIHPRGWQSANNHGNQPIHQYCIGNQPRCKN